MGGEDRDVKAGDLVVVPAGTKHQFVNSGPTPLVCPSSNVLSSLEIETAKRGDVIIDTLYDLFTCRTQCFNGTPFEGTR